jgi:hypothetical protein
MIISHEGLDLRLVRMQAICPECGELPTHFFVDEAGNFDFSRRRDASTYFILTSVTMENPEAADALIHLRRQLVWEGLPITNAFHATTDKQDVRNRVFDEISRMDIRVDATIFEKGKTVPHRQQMLPFYKLAWFYHAMNVIPVAISRDQPLHVIAASLATKNTQIQVASAIKDFVDQCGRSETTTRVNHWPAGTDPCLQVADYCCWAIQRKWERQDDRSHLLIRGLIQSEYEMWSRGRKYYY